MAVVSATTTGGTSATPVGLSSLGSSSKLPPVTSVLVPEQSINDALTTLLPACPNTESSVVPGIDVSSAVPPDLSEVVPGDFDVSVEPHEGEAATTSTGEERAVEEEDTPVCKLCDWFLLLLLFFFVNLLVSVFHFLSLLCCRFESVSIPEDEREVHGIVSEIEKDNTGRRC